MKDNIARAALYSRDVYRAGYFPMCIQIYLEAATGLNETNNPQNRPRALELGLEFLAMCDELWVFGRREGEESQGMINEIKEARKKGIPVHYCKEYLLSN